MMTARQWGAQRGVEGWVWHLGDAAGRPRFRRIRLLPNNVGPVTAVAAAASRPNTSSLPFTDRLSAAGENHTLNGVQS